jgi:hypothetical protein
VEFILYTIKNRNMRARGFILSSISIIVLFIFSASVVSQVISARTLYNYSPNNEVAFDLRYKGKTIKVVGEVYSIEKDILGTYYMLLEGDVYEECVQLYFTSRALTRLSSIEVGDELVIEGICTGRGIFGNVELKSCTILEIRR